MRASPSSAPSKLRPGSEGARCRRSACVVLTEWLGLYVAAALYMGVLHALDRPPPLGGGRGPSACRLPVVTLPRLREVVPGADAQGTSGEPGWATDAWDSRTSSWASQVAITPYNLFIAVVGIMLGTIIGVLPGLGGANGVRHPAAADLHHAARPRPSSCSRRIYWGALFGGAITSVLFNIPGEPWSVATTFDGYPDGPAGAGGAGADRRVHVVVRRRRSSRSCSSRSSPRSSPSSPSGSGRRSSSPSSS